MSTSRYVLVLALCCALVLVVTGCSAETTGTTLTTAAPGESRGGSEPTAEETGLYTIYREGDKYGYIDHTGRIAIEPLFDGAYDFSEGLAAVTVDEITRGFIDSTGAWVIQPRFEDVLPFAEGLAAVRVNDKGGYIDKTGKFVIEPRDWYGYSFSDGVALVHVTENGVEMAGYIDQTGTWVIEPDLRYSRAGAFHDGLVVVWTDHGQWGVIDKTGAWVVQPQFLGIAAFSEGLAVIGRIGNDTFGLYDCGYLDKTGAMVIAGPYYRAQSFSEGLAAVTRDGTTWGYIDKTGDFVIQPAFVEAGSFDRGLALVAIQPEVDPSSRRYGYIDQTGAWAIPPQFYHASPFGSGGLARVNLDPLGDTRAYIDATGEIVRQWEDD
jgi:hypothetical protein